MALGKGEQASGKADSRAPSTHGESQICGSKCRGALVLRPRRRLSHNTVTTALPHRACALPTIAVRQHQERSPVDPTYEPLQSKQVLYVEDHPVNALLMQALFERRPGY